MKKVILLLFINTIYAQAFAQLTAYEKNHPWLTKMFEQKQVGQSDSLDEANGLWVQPIGLGQQAKEEYIIGVYQNGKRQDNWKRFIDDKIVSECGFKNDVPNGYFKIYDNEERIRAIFQVKMGNIEGEGHFFENGKLIAIIEFTDKHQYKFFYKKGGSMAYIKIETFFNDFERWK